MIKHIEQKKKKKDTRKPTNISFFIICKMKNTNDNIKKKINQFPLLQKINK